MGNYTMRRKLNLKEIQEAEYKILREVSRICREQSLAFSLDSGTLLGAVRHCDFIPWDDDIDLIMPRSDYNKACQVLPHCLPSFYKFVMCSHRPFSKIIDVRTNVSNNTKNQVIQDNYLWIDIFPIDIIPEDKEVQKRLFSKIQRLLTAQMRANTIIGTGSTPFRAIAKLPFLIIPKLHGVEYYNAQIEKLLLQNDYDSSRMVGPAFFKKHPSIPREDFDNLIKLPFHGEEFYAIPHWDSYLTQLYGDYMTLPPEDKRQVHLVDAWIDENDA